MIFYLVGYYYLEQVLPDNYGVKREWNYCIHDGCDCNFREEEDEEKGGMMEIYAAAHDDEGDEGELDSPVRGDSSSAKYHQKVEGSQYGSKIIGLHRVSKSFGPDQIINSIDLNIYEREVLCLLGHNGAGKTTIINMLTGILDVSSGGIIYSGVPINQVLDKYRDAIGLCCQQDILYKELTAHEHLRMVGQIKGLKGEILEEEI